jgi:hypothetical protein
MIHQPELKAALLDITDAMEAALLETSELQTKNAELETRLGTQEKVYLEKVASARQEAAQAAVVSIFPEKELRITLKKLAALQILTPAELPAVEEQIRQTPALILPFMLKMANAVLSAPSEGHGIAAERPTQEDDPDGWKSVARGEAVQLRSYIT